MNADLFSSGERAFPNAADINWQRHQFAHLIVARFAQPEFVVLDYGCGEGYGSAFISNRVREVIATDISDEVIAHARAKYFELRNIQWLTYTEYSSLMEGQILFNLIYLIQSFEHVEDRKSLLDQLNSHLVPNGILIIVTPNRLTYSPDGIWNQYHVWEYKSDELYKELKFWFNHVEIFGIHPDLTLACWEQATAEYILRRKRLQQLIAKIPSRSLRTMLKDLLFSSDDYFRPEAVTTNNFTLLRKANDCAMDLVAMCRK